MYDPATHCLLIYRGAPNLSDDKWSQDQLSLDSQEDHLSLVTDEMQSLEK